MARADTTPPSEITGLQYTANSNSVAFTWTNPTNSDFNHVNVYRNSTLLTSVTSPTASYTDSGVQPSTTYTYKFTTVDTTGNESTGTTVSVTTAPPSDTTPPSEVTNVKSSFTSNSITLTWTNPTDSDYSHTTITRIGMTAYNTYGGTSFTDNTGISTGNNYTYFMYTWDTSGNESKGIQVNVSTVADVIPPADVTNLQYTISNNILSFTWVNPTDSDFLKVNTYLNGSLVAGTSGNSYTYNNYNPSNTYVFKFTTVDTTGNESSGIQVTVGADTTPPSEVSNLQHTDSATSESFTWTNPSDSDFSHINVYRDGSLLASPTTASYTDSTVQPSTTYTYKFTTVDSTGNESTGTTLQVTTLASNSNSNVAPSIPTNLFPFNNSAWTKLHFEADVTDSDNTSLTFYVEYSTDSTLTTGVTTLSAPVILPSVGQTARASITSANTIVESTVYYWRAYVSDGTNQSAKTSIFNFTAKFASGDNMPPDGTKFMPQGSYNNVNMIDVSDYQGTIDWAGVKSSGINYAIMCTRHCLADDTMFPTYVTQSKAQGIKTGGYFFPNPSVPLDLQDARNQADHFITLLQAGYGTGQYGDLLPMLDLEDNTDRVSGTGQTYTILDLTIQETLQWADEFRKHFESVTGRTLGLYVPEYFIHEQRGNFNVDPSTGGAFTGTLGNILIDMPIWISGFTGYARYQGGVMPVAGGWTDWQVFQHGDTSYGEFTVTGVSTTVDLDWSKPIEWISPPNAVTGLSAVSNSDNVQLTWNPTTEQDVSKWDIYVDGNKVGSSSTNGSYTIINAPSGTRTVEVRPVDYYGDTPITSPNTISYTVVANPPLVNITNVTHYTLSDEQGFTSTDITFTFSKDITAWTVNVNGVSYDSGVVADSGGDANGNASIDIATASTMLVGDIATRTVYGLIHGSITVITTGTEIIANIDWTELYSEGQNRINIYGKDESGDWTIYES